MRHCEEFVFAGGVDWSTMTGSRSDGSCRLESLLRRGRNTGLPRAERPAMTTVPQEHPTARLSNAEPTARGRWMALVAALLGWMFDGFEMGMFPLVGQPALAELLAGQPAEV